jgi:hypothetical protein
METDRFLMVNLRVEETVGHTPEDTPGKAHKGLVAEWIPECQACADKATVTSLERTLTRPGISEETRQDAEARLAALGPKRAA